MPSTRHASLDTIRAVALDGFGTTVYISNFKRPFQRLCEAAGCNFDVLDMSRPVQLEEFAKQIGVSELLDLRPFHQDLHEEAASLTLYPETLEVIGTLRKNHIKVAIASNVTSIFPFYLRQLLSEHVDLMYLSCDKGTAKPSTEFFRRLSDELSIPAQQILMVGDTYDADYAGARSSGFGSLLLDRSCSMTTSQFEREASVMIVGTLWDILGHLNI